MMKSLFGLCAAATMLISMAPAQAAEITVQMLNKGSDGAAMVFEPAAIQAEVGDVIRFVPTDRGHDAASIKDLVPEGAEVFKGKINQSFEVVVAVPGLYVVKCTPHFAMGMVAVIAVGKIEDGAADALRVAKLPKKAKERIALQLVSIGQ